ncbi:hypothetical protein PR202_ga10862 [Eleusine coracana subsp. coracana]|uniref:Uncharacterized protein n=1 Tax=Eleusine coracana subsp. coracana TaxID=191504 RepID=A0AAV5C814_ELECO|nr:hypothetical protein PR202_ga10862 [Eleusine coracana subsp. coracana]
MAAGVLGASLAVGFGGERKSPLGLVGAAEVGGGGIVVSSGEGEVEPPAPELRLRLPSFTLGDRRRTGAP